jgi:carbon monoxide dehydrogenase subunit G
MEMTGEQRIALPQQKVWEALNDPQILKACIPGCESIEKVSDNEYKVAMTAAVGPVKAKFSGKLLLSDLNPPNSYSLAFEGSGGAAGFGKGTAQVSLQPEGNETLLTYKASATVGGKLAQIGSRLIDGVAKKMSDDFFARFNQTVATPAAAEPVAGTPPADAAPAVQPSHGKAVPGWVWVVGAVLLMLVLFYALR